MRMMRRRPYIGALVALAIGGLGTAGCHRSAAADVEAQPSAQVIPVSVATAHQQSLERSAEIQGALFAKERATIASQVEGNVAQVYADLGDSVTAGQLMLQIDPREYQLHVGSAEAALNQASARSANSAARFNRATELRRDGTMSPEQYDQIASTMRIDKADEQSAQRALDLARKKLGDTQIRAPFSGSVQKRMVSLGEYVAPGKQVYEVIATDPIKLRCPMPERIVPLAKVGMPVNMTIDARPGDQFTGVITRIAPALDEDSRTLLVEAEVRNPSGALKPGFFAHVTMNLGQDRALFVPQSSVLRYAGVARVFVIDNGIARSREVKTGAVVGDQVEIVAGLHEGDRVASSGIDRLADGAAVKVQS
jgi:membrane fusion protein (multidrug efflux system)